MGIATSSEQISTWDHQNYKGKFAFLPSEFLTKTAHLAMVSYARALKDFS